MVLASLIFSANIGIQSLSEIHSDFQSFLFLYIGISQSKGYTLGYKYLSNMLYVIFLSSHEKW